MKRDESVRERTLLGNRDINLHDSDSNVLGLRPRPRVLRFHAEMSLRYADREARDFLKSPAHLRLRRGAQVALQRCLILQPAREQCI